MLLLRTFVALCALILIALPALETEAQPRGGGGRGGGRSANISRSGPASHGSVRHSNRNRARTGRAVKRERRSERHEYFEDRGRRLRIGARMTVATYRALSCQPTTAIVDGVAFYGCGGGWYNRRVYSGTVTYVVVTAPAGY